jgi:two-component system, OmpR family, sensor histidine kinase VanS
MARRRGLSVRVRLTLSYTAFLLVAGTLLLSVVWVFLLRYVPVNQPAAFGPPSGPDRVDLVRAFVPPAIWALLFLLVLSLIGGWVLAGWMLAPLSRISNATRRVANGSFSHRVELEGRNDEFRELADSFDAMLARLEAHDSEQRRFAANASHELRTPLAIIQTLLDVARNDKQRNSDELIERLHIVNTRAIDLTEALLVLSRADQGVFTKERVDLSLIAEEVAEELLPLAEKRGITVTVAGVAAMTMGSRVLLHQLILNLVHNGIVYNAGEGGTVTVTTSAVSGDVMLTVENTGLRLDSHVVSTLTEPFQRGTARVRSHESGVGLGLAIVASIANAHSGALALTPRTTGGLIVRVKLPGDFDGDG